MQPHDGTRNRSRTAAGVGLAILTAGAGLVGITGVGIDILAVALLVLVLLLLDRTVGDWLAEQSTSSVPSLLFAGLLAGVVCLLFLTTTGAEWMGKLLQFGETRGYQGLWIKSQSSHTVVAESPAAGSAPGKGAAPSPGVRTSAGPAPSSARLSLKSRFAGQSSPRPGLQPSAVSLKSPDPAPPAADGESRGTDSPETTPAAATAGSRATVTQPGANDGPSSPGNASEATTTVLNVTPGSARPGEDVAAVAVVTRAHGQVQTGRVDFSVNGVVYSSALVGGDGTAHVLLQGLGPGLSSIRARFTGSANLLPSASSPVRVTITPNR
jgi:Bacterial Ig-like domain (group 3)